MKKVAFYTLGCKVNQYDTEAVSEQFVQKGYEVVAFSEYADVYVVNTCTVTHLSDRKCRQILRKTKRINPNSVLVAMGCYAQSAGDSIKKEVEEVDIIVGTNKRSALAAIVEDYLQNQQHYNYVDTIMDIEEFEELKIGHMDERTRVYLKIQEGCNNYCTYCIIPYVRGKIRSRKLENVIDEAKRLSEAGFKEIVLTGIHVASYGKDLENTTLLDAIKAVHAIEGIERIRLSSIEPVVITETFLEGISQLPKLCHHFHLSLQSGCDTVLKRMNRKYTTKDYEKSVNALRALWPDVAITTDLIVGFPGETEEEFEQTKIFVKRIGFTQVHLFPYSQREGTVAAKMANQIDPSIKEQRLKTLQDIIFEQEQQLLERYKGKTVEVLVEHVQDNQGHGYTSNYLKVVFSCDQDKENTLVQVKVKNAHNHQLEGELLAE